MGQRSDKFKREHNRLGVAKAPERLCLYCKLWKPLEAFKITHNWRGYGCYPCERQRQREREKLRPSSVRKRQPGRRCPKEPVFDESRVDVYGLMLFSSVPTPAQLLRRKVA